MTKNSQTPLQHFGIIIVSYGHQKTVELLLDVLKDQKQDGDLVVVLDNHSAQKTAELAKKHQAVDQVLVEDNIGFALGCNKAAEAILEDVDLLLFLNPDTLLQTGALEALRGGARPGWGGWMGLLTLPDGTVNSAGNVVHMSGLSWVGGYGEATNAYTESKEVSVLSGADVVVRTDVWRQLEGFAPLYFLYYEDTDLSFRMLLLGYRLGLVPGAHVQHDYDFDKGGHKWFYIERNRYLFIVRVWPAPVILVLLPFLLLLEPVLWLISLLQGRFGSKLCATGSALKLLPQAWRQRQGIQSQRVISSRQFMAYLEPAITTTLLGGIARNGAVTAVFKAYYWVACHLLPKRPDGKLKTQHS